MSYHPSYKIKKLNTPSFSKYLTHYKGNEVDLKGEEVAAEKVC